MKIYPIIILHIEVFRRLCNQYLYQVFLFWTFFKRVLFMIETWLPGKGILQENDNSTDDKNIDPDKNVELIHL